MNWQIFIVFAIFSAGFVISIHSGYDKDIALPVFVVCLFASCASGFMIGHGLRFLKQLIRLIF